MGGGMRQAGYLAAAGLYAMQHNINRLAEDHAHAKQLADALKQCSWVGEIFPVETNIVIFEVAGPQSAQEVVAKFLSHNIRASAMSPTHIRLVTHLDVTPEMIQRTVEVLKGL
jgi:threonine aldolase